MSTSNKLRRRKYAQWAKNFLRCVETYQHKVISDMPKNAVDWYNHKINEVSTHTSSIIEVRSKKHLLNAGKKSMKLHWQSSDTIKAIYKKQHSSVKATPAQVLVKSLKNGLKLIKLRNKKFIVRNSERLYRLKCKHLNRVYVRKNVNSTICEMLKNNYSHIG